MKTSPLDFIVGGLCIALIGAVALVVTATGIAPFSRQFLGPYHVMFDSVIFLLSFGLLAAVFLRLMLRIWPLRPGEYSMDHSHFTYWKIFTVVYEFGRFALRPFTIVFATPVIASLFGAKVGRNTAFAGHMNEPPLISIGDGAVLGQYCVVTGHAITSGRIILREVKIGQHATVGVSAVIMPGVEVGDGSVVAACSVVPLGTRIGPGELWAGIPAKKIKDLAQTDIRG